MKEIMIFDEDLVNPPLAITYIKKKVLLSQIWIMMKHYAFEVMNSQNYKQNKQTFAVSRNVERQSKSPRRKIVNSLAFKCTHQF